MTFQIDRLSSIYPGCQRFSLRGFWPRLGYAFIVSKSRSERHENLWHPGKNAIELSHKFCGSIVLDYCHHQQIECIHSINGSVNFSCAHPPRATAGHLRAFSVPGSGISQPHCYPRAFDIQFVSDSKSNIEDFVGKDQ